MVWSLLVLTMQTSHFPYRYIFFYQIPYIPELLVKAYDFILLKRVFQEKPMGLVNKTGMSSEDLEVFRYTFSQEGKYISRA